MFNKFISRKFLTAVALFAGAILAASGVIDPTNEEAFASALVGVVYIITQGFIDKGSE